MTISTTIVKPLKFLMVGVAITGASVAAFAQTTTTAPMGSTLTPAAVGVSPQNAAEANRQAVPRSDTATVVRTSPDAVDIARTAASAATGSTATMGTGSASGSITSSGMATGTGTDTDTETGSTMRPPKADRN